MVKKRGLSFTDVFCLGLNAIIGSGIFLFPGTLAALVGPASVLAFLVCGLLLSAVALCYAELGAMLPGNGGSYLYAREAFGDRVGYGVGLIAWAAAVLSWSAVAAVLAGHLGYFHPVFESKWFGKFVAVALLVVFSGINWRGVKLGAWTVDGLTAAKVVPLIILVAACLPKGSSAAFVPFWSGEGRFGYAVFLALWALQGFEVAPVPAGETENPQRDLPRAVLGSLLTAAVFYAIIQAAVVASFPGLAGSKERPLADAAAFVMGGWGGALLGAGGIVSMMGFVAGAALGAPRYLSALGERSLRRWRLDAEHARFGTPHRAIGGTCLTGVVLILLLDFASLIDLANLAVVSQYLASCLALIALRRSRPDAVRPYRVPAGPWVAAGGALVSVWLMTNVTPPEIVGTALVLAAGYGLRFALDGGTPSGTAREDNGRRADGKTG
jgi:amino acid transporter